MDEFDGLVLVGQRAGVSHRVAKRRAVQDDIGAVIVGRFDLGLGRGGGHHDGRGNAPLARGECDALSVITRARGDDSLDVVTTLE